MKSASVKTKAVILGSGRLDPVVTLEAVELAMMCVCQSHSG